EGLGPLHQFGDYFAEHRYIAFTFLGFFSPLVKWGDTLAVAGLFQAWTLFVLAAAVYLYWAAEKQPTGVAVGATSLAVLSGWLATVVWGNFYDQGLALVYMPALAAVPALWRANDGRRWLALGCLTAAAMYTYSICVPFIVGGAGLVLLPVLWRE